MAYQKSGGGKRRSFSDKKNSDRPDRERRNDSNDRSGSFKRRSPRPSEDRRGPGAFREKSTGFRRGEERPAPKSKEERNRSESYGKPYGKPEFTRKRRSPGQSEDRRGPGSFREKSGFRRGEDRPSPKPKEERKRSEYYGKPYGKPEFTRKRRDDKPGKSSFVESRLARQRKFINERSQPEIKKDPEEVRLNKFISNSGICSRREADNLISMGLVTVNGKTITEMGHKVRRTDDIRYEGKRLTAERPVYILLNKPKGFITTTEDPQERNTVMNLIAGACSERVYPVGRLDRNTTGLLLFTNDGELAEKLTHPSYNVRKIYKVDLDRPLTKADFQKIKDGVRLEEGRAMVDDLAIVDDSGKTIGIELHIGWNRIVRRIFESLDYQVLKLDRVVYAGLDKKDLPRGKWRLLKDTEVIKLKHFNKKPSPSS